MFFGKEGSPLGIGKKIYNRNLREENKRFGDKHKQNPTGCKHGKQGAYRESGNDDFLFGFPIHSLNNSALLRRAEKNKKNKLLKKLWLRMRLDEIVPLGALFIVFSIGHRYVTDFP